MSQAVQKITPSVAVVSDATGAKIAPSDLDQAIRFAEIMCRGDIAIPKHLRGNQGACLAVTMQALQWGMNPFTVASKSYYVNGTIAYEAQLISAAINTRSNIKGRLKYKFDGEGDELTCTVTGNIDGEDYEYISPKVKDINPKNSPLWKSDPQQQLSYYSSRAWARRYYSEVLLGVYARDELEQARDITPANDKPTILMSLEAKKPANNVEGFNREHLNEEAETLTSGEDSLNSDEMAEATDDVTEAQTADDVADYSFNFDDFIKELAEAVISVTDQGELAVVEKSKLFANGNLDAGQKDKARDVVTIAREISRGDTPKEDGVKRIAGIVGIDYRVLTAGIQPISKNEANDQFNEEQWLKDLALQLYKAIASGLDEYESVADRIYPSEMNMKLSEGGCDRAKSIYNLGLKACKNELSLENARIFIADVANLSAEDLQQ
ncbi:MAG: hypothetical protein [Bacteriophage sp.]|nr:MAG: hypothetical protein [Bacteriophage sp.]